MCNACGVMWMGCSIFQGAPQSRRPFALEWNRFAVKYHVALRTRFGGRSFSGGLRRTAAASLNDAGYTMSPLRGQEPSPAR